MAGIVGRPRCGVLTRASQLCTDTPSILRFNPADVKMSQARRGWQNLPFQLRASREERLWGLVLFFDLGFGAAQVPTQLVAGDATAAEAASSTHSASTSPEAPPEVAVFTTHPGAADTHYNQLILNFPRAVKVGPTACLLIGVEGKGPALCCSSAAAPWPSTLSLHWSGALSVDPYKTVFCLCGVSHAHGMHMAHTWHTHRHGRLPPTALPDPLGLHRRVGMTKHALMLLLSLLGLGWLVSQLRVAQAGALLALGWQLSLVWLVAQLQWPPPALPNALHVQRCIAVPVRPLAWLRCLLGFGSLAMGLAFALGGLDGLSCINALAVLNWQGSAGPRL
ncbi:predicted protein [Haematococcus lacustris]|uniref:Uncharacterized protein n=1 Tax=Haematococcus lacustris TaxID=44745 RepID=A0A6A0A7N2_HAELA|nr:predicted protein [Haematococcus lacustris]